MWASVLGEIKYIEIFIIFTSFLQSSFFQNIFASYFSNLSAISCAPRAHMPEALPAALTAVMKIYTRMELSFSKPRRSSHLFHLL